MTNLMQKMMLCGMLACTVSATTLGTAHAGGWVKVCMCTNNGCGPHGESCRWVYTK